MKKTKPYKSFFILIISLLLFRLFFFTVDRIYGTFKNKHSNFYDTIVISKGDIIMKVPSHIMSEQKGLLKTMPHFGHIAIAENDAIVNVDDEQMRGLKIIESCVINHKKKKIVYALTKSFAEDNFGRRKGKRFLIKTKLSNSQKQNLFSRSEKWIGAPYNLFAKKGDSTSFNCATFVWNAFYTIGIDVDSDGGRFVFPTDILQYFKDKPKYKIVRF